MSKVLIKPLIIPNPLLKFENLNKLPNPIAFLTFFAKELLKIKRKVHQDLLIWQQGAMEKGTWPNVFVYKFYNFCKNLC